MDLRIRTKRNWERLVRFKQTSARRPKFRFQMSQGRKMGSTSFEKYPSEFLDAADWRRDGARPFWIGARGKRAFRSIKTEIGFRKAFGEHLRNKKKS